MLHVPTIREVFLVGTRKRALSVVAPTLWNIIPLEIERLAPILIFFLKGPEDLVSRLEDPKLI